MSIKNPLTPAGIKPATLQFVAQYLNHCATTVPNTVLKQWEIACCTVVYFFYAIPCIVHALSPNSDGFFYAPYSITTQQNLIKCLPGYFVTHPCINIITAFKLGVVDGQIRSQTCFTSAEQIIEHSLKMSKNCW